MSSILNPTPARLEPGRGAVSYGKLFSGAFTGSMMGSGADVFAVWAYVIASTRGDDHTCELNPRHLSALIGMSEDRVRVAIDFLAAPDPASRSPAEEGRRIVHVEAFRYRVVNHEKYREIGSKITRRQSQRDWVAKKRAREKMSTETSTNVDKRRPVDRLSTYTEAEAEAEAQSLGSGDLLSPVVTSRSGGDVKLSRAEGGADPGPAPRVPSCPHRQIIDLYHEILPQLPRIEVISKSRQRAIQARWREHPGIDLFREFFNRVADSPFLLGKVPPRNGRERPFRANIDWLMTDRNFTRVTEGFYCDD